VIIDEIPCIDLSDEDEEENEHLCSELTNDFTSIQQEKEKNNIKDILEDLKKNFRNKKE